MQGATCICMYTSWTHLQNGQSSSHSRARTLPFIAINNYIFRMQPALTQRHALHRDHAYHQVKKWTRAHPPSSLYQRPCSRESWRKSSCKCRSASSSASGCCWWRTWWVLRKNRAAWSRSSGRFVPLTGPVLLSSRWGSGEACEGESDCLSSWGVRQVRPFCRFSRRWASPASPW